jgi:alpha-methylacyl-CoA racemase
MSETAPGPLHGLRIVEIGSIGPGPFCAMLLADFGADVVKVDRAGSGGDPLATGTWNVMNRGRPSVAVDLKHEQGREVVLRLIAEADGLIEGFRPGVMERLGLGPDVALERNPRLVFGRMTGYGQDGPMSSVAGHDINYISVAGALGAIKREGERPMPPLNLVGDFGGGGMLLALGMLAALLEAKSSGKGQVVDAAMVDGAALLSTLMYGLASMGAWDRDKPGTNLLDTGAHFYEVYETSDGGFVAVGAIEPQFYAELLRLLEIPAAEMQQFDKPRWGEFKQRLAAVFATKTRAEWAAILEPADACATAVYSYADAHEHPHNVARGTFVEYDGLLQPAPAPRFSRTPAAIRSAPAEAGADTDTALAAWGFGTEELGTLRDSGAFG